MVAGNNDDTKAGDSKLKQPPKTPNHKDTSLMSDKPSTSVAAGSSKIPPNTATNTDKNNENDDYGTHGY